MRICMITSAPFPAYEGLGMYVWNLSRHLVEAGNQVSIITRGGVSRTQKETVNGIAIYRAPFVAAYPFHAHAHGVFVDRIVQELEVETDIFHLHSPLVKFPKTQKPTFVTAQTTVRANANSIAPTNMLGWLYKMQTPISAHLEHKLFHQATKLSVVANSGVDDLAGYGVKREKVSVLGNGVDTRIFSPGRPSEQREKPYFLTVCRLGLRKGLEDLIQCAELVLRQHPGYQFLIAGTGPLKSELEKMIKQHDLGDGVVLLGHISERDRLVELLRGSTAYVHPAHYEGLPAALLEAMACGCPIVATKVSGALDVIEHGENGLLVSPKNPKQLANSVIKLIQDPKLHNTLGINAHQTIAERYSWNIVCQGTVDQYQMLL